MPAKKTWQEKLNESKGYPKVEEINGRMTRRWGTGTLVIPAPIEVDQLMKKVPKSKLTTINQIRSALATKHKATIGCPLTTGIFAWVSPPPQKSKNSKAQLISLLIGEPSKLADS